MAVQTTNLSIRMDVDTKHEAEAMFNALGMSLTTAINIFIHQALRTRSIPFRISMDVPNQTTIAAMEEARRLAGQSDVRKYDDVEEALQELKK